jgi:hypothetical protein
MHRVINVCAFQIGWFACVVGAARGMPLLGPAVVLILLGLHLLLTPDATRELRLIIAAGVIGSTIDTAVMMYGVYSFAGQSLPWLCPLWITALWMNFATTLHTSLSWLARQYVLAAALGAVAGPFSYYAGVRLGALTLHTSLTTSMAVLALVWGMTLPSLLRVAELTARPAQARANTQQTG